MMADSNSEATLLDCERVDGALMRGHKGASRFEKSVAFRGETDEPRRALNQATPQPVFQTFDLQAHRGLRGVHCLRRSCEALEIGHQDESLNGFKVERLHGGYH